MELSPEKWSALQAARDDIETNELFLADARSAYVALVAGDAEIARYVLEEERQRLAKVHPDFRSETTQFVLKERSAQTAR